MAIETSIPQHTIGIFVRDRARAPRGLVIANKVDGKVRIAWSYTSNKDVFDRNVAWKVALARLEGGTNKVAPKCVQKVIEEMTARCTRYFKDSGLAEVA